MVNLNQDKTRVKTVRMITFTFIPHNNQKVSRAGGAKSEIRVILIYNSMVTSSFIIHIYQILIRPPAPAHDYDNDVKQINYLCR